MSETNNTSGASNKMNTRPDKTVDWSSPFYRIAKLIAIACSGFLVRFSFQL